MKRSYFHIGLALVFALALIGTGISTASNTASGTTAECCCIPCPCDVACDIETASATSCEGVEQCADLSACAAVSETSTGDVSECTIRSCN